MAGEYQNSSEYIQHHLTNLTYGRFDNGEWGFAHGPEDLAAPGFPPIANICYKDLTSNMKSRRVFEIICCDNRTFLSIKRYNLVTFYLE